jgi:hypothetical protein
MRLAAQRDKQLARRSFEIFLDGLLCHGRHHGKPSLVGMKAVIGKIAFQQTFVIDHCAEIVEVGQVIVRAVLLQPFVKSKNPTHRTLSEKILRLWGVVVYRENRRNDQLNVVCASEFREIAKIGLNVFVRDRPGISGNIIRSRFKAALASR